MPFEEPRDLLRGGTRFDVSAGPERTRFDDRHVGFTSLKPALDDPKASIDGFVHRHCTDLPTILISDDDHGSTLFFVRNSQVVMLGAGLSYVANSQVVLSLRFTSTF